MRRKVETIEETWEKYWLDRNEESKKALMAHYYPLVERVAKKMARNLPSNVEVDDLIGDGVFGLVDAIERFDPSKGFKLETFALQRVRGEMYDRLRAADWVPRALRTKAKRIDAAMQELEQTLNRKATIAEIAEAVSLTEEETQEAISLVMGYSMVTMDSVHPDEESVSYYGTVAENNSNTSQNYDAVELMEQVATSMKRLSGRERVVMVLYYHEDMTLQRIGTELGVTESRACQIHNRALSSIRSMCIDLS